MRVALCLSGQARGIDLTWPIFLENIINPTNCDVFISFANDSSLDNFYKIDHSRITEVELIKDPDLEYLYSIAKGDVEYIQHLGDMKKECTNLAVLRQYYYINRANNMKIEYEKKNNFIYNWVIRSRADLYIEKTIDNLSLLDNNYIYSPSTDTSGGLNDFFAFGSSKNMDIYCDRIGEIRKIDSPPWPFWNPHIELKYILDKNGIQVVMGDMGIRRERNWRGLRDENCHKFYGVYGEELIKSRLGKV
jgi:hypothetical protein